MKHWLLLLFVGVLAVTALAAEVVITSLNPNGELTWTNSVSNATYRVEWGGSSTGPWNRMEALTNLSSVSGTNNSVTVKVPMFYRVVWTDAPAYAGQYELREYNTNGDLVVAGRLSLTGAPGSQAITGTRDLKKIGTATNALGDQWVYGPQIGPGTVVGGYANPTFPYVTLELKPEFVDNNVFLSGFLVGNTYFGTWGWTWGSSGILLAGGTFTATKQNGADSLPPPDPAGTWEYAGFGIVGIKTTGQLSFTTSTNPVLGTWRFDNPDPSFSGGHLLGDGTFTNAVISGNHLLIVIPATNQFFTLAGEMVGDSFAGLWRATGEAYYKGKGYFLARRKISPQTAAHSVGNNK